MNFRSKLEQKCYIVSKRLLYLGPFPARRHFQSAGDGIPLYRPLLRVCASTGEVNGTMVPARFADNLFDTKYLKASKAVTSRISPRPPPNGAKVLRVSM